MPIQKEANSGWGFQQSAIRCQLTLYFESLLLIRRRKRLPSSHKAMTGQDGGQEADRLPVLRSSTATEDGNPKMIALDGHYLSEYHETGISLFYMVLPVLSFSRPYYHMEITHEDP
ncbi:MAG: hypothetical protein JW927_03490 [Deltaproteobacteria bacterium]|nr:hypothetical protein [Deltaproteobacteria bacterium]